MFGLMSVVTYVSAQEKTVAPSSSFVSYRTISQQLAQQQRPVSWVNSRQHSSHEFDAYTTWSVKPGDQRILGDGLLFVPLWQDGETLVFADIRTHVDNDDNFEMNWGLGVRTFVDDDLIFGTYAFWDMRDSSEGGIFHQATIGAELLTLDWETRLNAYLPDGGSHLSDRSFVSLVNNRVLVNTFIERGYYGVDAEFGYRLKAWGENDSCELRVFAGGYHFDTHASGYQNISGPRGRVELRLYDLDWLGEGSRVTIGGEIQHDDVRDTQTFAMVRVRIPLGRQSQRQRLSPLRRRMIDRVVRDVDIVTNTNVIVEEAIDTLSNSGFGVVTIEDGTNTTLPATVTAHGRENTIVVDGSKGPVTLPAGTPIDLRNGQKIIGGGAQVAVYGAQTGTPLIWNVPGSRPTITQSDADVPVIIIDDRTVTRNLNVVGGGVGIVGISKDDIFIVNNHVSGADDSGVLFGDGIALAGTSSGTLLNNTSVNNDGDGFFIDIFTGGTISNNASRNNGDDGFEFDTILGGSLKFNLAFDNDDEGFKFDTFSGGEVLGNIAIGNGDDGFDFEDFTSGLFTLNLAIDNDEDGFDFDNDIIGGTITENFASDNAESGFDFDGEIRGGIFSENVSNDNTLLGYDGAVIRPAATVINNTGFGNSGGNDTLP